MKLLENLSEDCIKYKNSEKIISFSEHGKKYFATNDKQKDILGFKIDNCLIKERDTKKCDYGLIIENNICFLIELKGTDIKTACKQITATMNIFKTEYYFQKFVARIIISKTRTQKMNTAAYNELDKKLKKLKEDFSIPYNSIKISSKKMEDSI